MTDPKKLKPAAEMVKANQAHVLNESKAYRQARDALPAEEIELRRHIVRVAEQRRALPPGGEVTKDYRLDPAIWCRIIDAATQRRITAGCKARHGQREMTRLYSAAAQGLKRTLRLSAAVVAAFGLQTNAQAADTHTAKKETNMTPTLIQGRQGQLSTFRMGADNAGLPIIFVHADPGRALQWNAVMTLLSKKHDVAAFDSRGSGDSTPPANGDYSYEGRAADIGALADAYQMKRFVLVAHSAGAATALQYAALNGDRVAGLMMVDPATDPRAMPAKVRDGFIKDMTGPNSAQAFATYVESIAGPNAKVRKQVLLDAKKLSAEGRAGVAKAAGDWNPEITLNAYKGPMFILSTPATDNAGALYRLVPTIHHEVVSTKGHWIQLDHPALVEKAIAKFMLKLDTKISEITPLQHEPAPTRLLSQTPRGY
jgi:pimeloyl-ACP methyl ester carboxylesterase